MAWAKFKRLHIEINEPSITLNPGGFSYNAIIKKLAELQKNNYVVYHYDAEERKIGFEFSEKKIVDSYQVMSLDKARSCRSNARDLIAGNLWIKKVAELRNAEQRRFAAVKEGGGLWAIQLMPAFEYRAKKDDRAAIPSQAKGIYRYLDRDGNVVYIGKGNIKSRLNESGRGDWSFEALEWSVIESDSEQFEWETYWLNKYRESNNDKLPYYNKVSGTQD